MSRRFWSAALVLLLADHGEVAVLTQRTKTLVYPTAVKHSIAITVEFDETGEGIKSPYLGIALAQPVSDHGEIASLSEAQALIHPTAVKLPTAVDIKLPARRRWIEAAHRRVACTQPVSDHGEIAGLSEA